jgi:hypothetical protein
LGFSIDGFFNGIDGVVIRAAVIIVIGSGGFEFLFVNVVLDLVLIGLGGDGIDSFLIEEIKSGEQFDFVFQNFLSGFESGGGVE